MSKPWLQIDDLRVNVENIPGLLDRYNLLPDFLKRLLETKYTHNIIPDKEEQIKFFNSFLEENRIEGKESLQRWLIDNGLDDKRLDTMLFERLQIEKFKSQMFENKIESSFLKQKESLNRIMYSILRVKNGEQAGELYTQIEEKESSFAELVSKYSIGPEKNFNGIIGPIELGRLDAVLRERLKISKTGQLWPPFEFKKNWVILRLEKYLPCKLDDSMKLKIRNSMYQEWINKQVLNLLDQIRYKDKNSSKLVEKNNNLDSQNIVTE
mgnify:CR=1 FL=1|tara:strand:+ start:1172 stop:1972 length:801 start_codon:yes stop_codon:yes gene_type:complete